VRTSSHRSILVSLLVSLLDTISFIPCLFVGLSSSLLHSGTTSTLALSFGAVYFLFILYLTPHCTLLATYYHIYRNSSCIPLNSFPPLLLWVHSTCHLISTTSWILINRSIFCLLSPLLFPHLFQSPPLVIGDLLNHSIAFHVHNPSLYE
jgi:hypothetical protein